MLLSKDVALAEGVAAFVGLALLQLLIAFASSRSERVERIVKATPRVLLRDGCYLPTALKAERITESEVRSAIRKAGIGDLAAVAAVVLETDGSFSVIAADRAGDRSAWQAL